MFIHYVLFSYVIVYLDCVDGLYDEKLGLKTDPDDAWREVRDWSDGSVQLGELSAVSVDSRGHVYVFHRGNRVWNSNTFSADNIYMNEDQGPISTETIILFNNSTGAIMDKWGSYKFYMPHGLTVHQDGTVWTTDVALHQIMKFTNNGKTVLLTLGERFVPATDFEHFCKPTSVAILADGEFFVADGYCNSRILKYTADGKYITHWGTGLGDAMSAGGRLAGHLTHYTLSIPHALALAEDMHQLCVADRENGRVLCYDCHNGTHLWTFENARVGPRVFSVAYTSILGGRLYIVNGPAPYINVTAFDVDMRKNAIVSQFGLLSNPHDVAVTADGSQLYVVELEPFLIHKYVKGTRVEHAADGAAVASTDSFLQEPTSRLSEYQVWTVAGASALVIVLILVCALYMMIEVISRKKRDTAISWMSQARVDKVFRLNKLTERKKIGHGFQKLKMDDESDEDSVPMVNI